MKIRSSRSYTGFLLFMTAGVTASGIALLHTVAARWDVLMASLHGTTPTCGCAAAFFSPVDPWHTIIFFAIGGIFLFLFIWMIVVTFSMLIAARRHRRFVQQQTMGHRILHGYDVALLDSVVPLVFCEGFLQRRIIVSRGALILFPAEELRAVLQHEHAHAYYFHPVQLWFLQWFARVFFLIPGLHEWVSYVRLQIECEADDAAGDQHALQSAVLRLAHEQQQGGGVLPTTVAALNVTEARIDRFLGCSPVLSVLRRRLIIMLASITAIIGLAWGARAASIAEIPVFPPSGEHCEEIAMTVFDGHEIWQTSFCSAVMSNPIPTELPAF